MSKQLSMSEIKAIYQAADESMLPDFISRFIVDERKGVQDLIEKADKRAYTGVNTNTEEMAT